MAVAEPSRTSEEQKELGKRIFSEEECERQRKVLLERLGVGTRKYMCAIIGKNEIAAVQGKLKFQSLKTNWGVSEYLVLSFGPIWDNAVIRFSSNLSDLPYKIVENVPY